MKSKILIWTAFCMFASCSTAEISTKPSKVIAHRGGANLGNENTVSCVQKGIASGAYAVEVDVHQSKDGALIVCHDETINRTTNGKGRIEDMTLEELKSVRIRDSVTGEVTEETLPVLSEVLKTVKGRCQLLLEVKRTRANQYEGIEEKILAELDSTGTRDIVTIQSFNDSVLERMHGLAPDIPLEKLFVCRLPFGKILDNHINSFSLEKYNYVRAFNTYGPLTSSRFVRQMHDAGFQVNVWTVDNPSKVKKGVNGVITNSPDKFL